jgi:pimeloyl-ACP methyl ester carboxylesterase
MNRSGRCTGLKTRPIVAETQVIYQFGDYQIDTARFEIARAGRTLAVEPQVLELLIVLIENRDHVVSKDEVFGKIWKGRIVSDTTLSSRIKTARQLIGDTGARQQYIKTIHGRGFRFVGNVETKAAAPPAPAAETPKSATPERPVTRYARSGDIHVAYHLFGNGPINLILAPGFVSHIDNYWDNPPLNRFLHRLGELARCAIFDKRGTGLSDPVSSLPGMDERMDDLRAVMDAAGFETAFVMGISEGGSLATLFAAHHPDRCDGLILWGAFARFKHWLPDEAALQRWFDYFESDWGSGKSLPLFAPSVGNDPEFVRWWGKFERLGATPGAVIALMRMNSRIDIFDVLPSVQVPTLVLHVANDVLIDVQGGRDLAARIPGAKYVEFPGVDHLPMVGENPDRIINAVAPFLEHTKQRGESNRILATILLVCFDPKARGGLPEHDAQRIKQHLQRFRATRISSQPDHLAATFDGPARALECAVSVSRLLRERGHDCRLAVHTGEVRFDGGAIEGTAVNIACDVADRARHNEILVSRTVNDLVAGSGIALQDRGEFALPSINQTWHLFQVEA